MRQREKLNRCYQNDKSVREYIYELSELWNMIGDVAERQKVTRLWTGLKAEIQTELWKKELNPESSSFREVASAAEIIEIAHSVPTRARERRAKEANGGGNSNHKQSKAKGGPHLRLRKEKVDDRTAVVMGEPTLGEVSRKVAHPRMREARTSEGKVQGPKAKHPTGRRRS
jgi:hypothetical protein